MIEIVSSSDQGQGRRTNVLGKKTLENADSTGSLKLSSTKCAIGMAENESKPVNTITFSGATEFVRTTVRSGTPERHAIGSHA